MTKKQLVFYSKSLLYAFEKTIFIGACVHLIILFGHALFAKDYIYFNLARALDLQLLMPWLSYTNRASIIALIPLVIIFVYFFLRGREKYNSQR